MATSTDTPRHAALRQLAEQYGVRIHPSFHSSTAEEDLAEFFYGEFPRELGAYVAVTDHDDVTYLTPYDSLEDAQTYAGENMLDDIFPEMPVEIVNLDTGEQWGPTVTVRWEKRGA